MNMKALLAGAAIAAAMGATSAANAADTVVYDGGSPNASSGNEATQWIQTENFTLANTASITDAHVYIAGTGGNISNWEGVANYYFFSDNGGVPGTLLASGAGANVTTTDTGTTWCCGGDSYKLSFTFPDFTATAGTEYFFGIHLATDFNNRDEIYWVTTSSNASGPGIESLGGTMDNWVENGQAHAFQLTSGVPSGVPEPSTWAMMGLGFAGLAFAGYRSRRTPAAIA
jgi:hypothetical protein